jgi:opacity protein-like surface antigen
MGRVNAPFLAAAFAAFSFGSAIAADALPPAPVLGKPIGPSAHFSDWYLRGDAGRALATTSEASLGTLPAGVTSDWSKPSGSAFYGIGLGYRLNDFLRVDASAEHRLPAKYSARTNHPCAPSVCSDSYSASTQSGVFLANAYFEAITWMSMTPFIGVGLGAATNQSSHVRDVGNTETASGAGASRWSLAWALMAGVAYEAVPGVHVELGYRYLDRGRTSLGAIACTADCAGAVKRFSAISHDVRMGVRFAFSNSSAAR